MDLTHLSRRTIISTASVLAFAVTTTAEASVAASHHDVIIEIDDVSTPVSGFFTTTDDVLASVGVKLGAHGLLAPSGQGRVEDGETIVVRAATGYEVEIDGKPTTARSTADSIDVVFDSLVESGEVVLTAADYLDVRTQMPSAPTHGPVEIFVDGQALKVDAEANDTVDVLLMKANVSLSQLDTLDFCAQGGHASLKVQRIMCGDVTRTSDIPFSPEEQKDDSVYMGEKEVTQEGANGSSSSTYYRGTINDETVISLLLSGTQTAPVNEIVSVDTKGKPSISALAAASTAPTGSFSPSSAQRIAQSMVAARDWSDSKFSCLVILWNHESGWRTDADNPSGAYGIPQAFPGSKMTSAGADWTTNPATQVTWGPRHISGRYGTPCSTYGHWQSNNRC